MEQTWSKSDSDSNETVPEPNLENPVVNPGYRRCPDCGSEKLYVTEDASAVCDHCGQAFMDVREELEEFMSNSNKDTPPTGSRTDTENKEIPPPPEDHEDPNGNDYEESTGESETSDYKICPKCGEENLYLTSDGSGFCDECGFSTLNPEEVEEDTADSEKEDKTGPKNTPPNDDTPPPPPEPDIPGPTPNTQKEEQDTRMDAFETSRYESCPNCQGGELYIAEDASAFCDDCGYASMDIREEVNSQGIEQDEEYKENENIPTSNEPAPMPEKGPDPAGEENEAETRTVKKDLTLDEPYYDTCPECGKQSFYIAEDASAFCDNCGHASMDIEEPTEIESEKETENIEELEEKSKPDMEQEDEPLPPSDEPSEDIDLDLPEDDVEEGFEYEIVQYEECPECGEKSFHCVTNDSGFCEECDYIATGFDEEFDFGITETVSPDTDAPDNEIKVEEQIDEDINQSTDKRSSPKSESPVQGSSIKTVKSPGYENCPECEKGSLYVTTDASAFCDNCGYTSRDIDKDLKER